MVASQMSKEDPLNLVEKGDAAFKDKDYGEAQLLYERALELANSRGQETNYIYSSLVKVHKRNKRYKEAYGLSRKAIPTPRGFRDCAVCLRALAHKAKKNGKHEELRKALNQLYKLATRACVYFADYDCKSGVERDLYDKAVYIHRRLPEKDIEANFQENGRIATGGLLTEQDYTLFTDVFGKNEKVYDPRIHHSHLIKAAEAEMERRELAWERCLWKREGRPEITPSLTEVSLRQIIYIVGILIGMVGLILLLSD
jgi:tetratricopeptide (TPR) repeat protein